MTDPFYMLMLIENLGPSYSIWDKEARIRYLKPGKTDLTAEFTLTEDELNDIRQKIKTQNPMHWLRRIEIKDKNQDVVAIVEKIISIKLKV